MCLISCLCGAILSDPDTRVNGPTSQFKWLPKTDGYVTLPPMPTPWAYYNEFDIKAAAWLRELIKAGHIAPGDVDSRSITEVQPADLDGYTQCHFFAGIGGWSYALRLAGWPDERPVWTGSCPCQPFSAAGKRGGTDDPRHLWPQFYRLICECRPTVVFGEQVASKDGLAWLDIVSADLERANYAIGAADLCAAGVGAPHIRQRLYFVADNGRERWQRGSYPERPFTQNTSERGENLCDVESCSNPGVVADSVRARLEISKTNEQHRNAYTAAVGGGDVGDAVGTRAGRNARTTFSPQSSLRGARHSDGRNGSDALEPTSAIIRVEHAASIGRQQRRPEPGRWSSVGGCEFIPCTDGKARPIEPSTFPLAHGVPHRVGLLRGYGNAIVPQVGAQFIGAYLDIAG